MANADNKDIDPRGIGESDDYYDDDRSFKSISRKGSSSSSSSSNSGSVSELDSPPPPPIKFSTRPSPQASLSNNFVLDSSTKKQAPRPPLTAFKSAYSSGSSSSSRDSLHGTTPTSQTSLPNNFNVDSSIKKQAPRPPLTALKSRYSSGSSGSSRDSVDEDQEPPLNRGNRSPSPPRTTPSPPPTRFTNSTIPTRVTPLPQKNQAPTIPPVSQTPVAVTKISRSPSTTSSDNDVDEYFPPEAISKPRAPTMERQNEVVKPLSLIVPSDSDSDEPPGYQSVRPPVDQSLMPVYRNDFPSTSSVDEYIPPTTKTSPKQAYVPIQEVQPVKVESNTGHITKTLPPGPRTVISNEENYHQRKSPQPTPPIFNKRPAPARVVDDSFPGQYHQQPQSTQNHENNVGVSKGSTRVDAGRDLTANVFHRSNPNTESDSTSFESSHGGRGVQTVKAKQGQLIYSWSNLNVRVGPEEKGPRDVEKGCLGKMKKKPVSKTILQNVTGVVYPGQLVAIMGASGAGKTTLLNVLTFRNTRNLKITGDRFVNGVPISSSSMLSSVSAYVQQDDLFIGTLTVREHLIFQARLRMDSHLSFKDRMQRVDEVISDLGLTKCRDTLIGIPGRIKGISGGEMKRLSFASEVLTDPALMFCDEPTSGLDSFMAYSVVSVLKDMARKGKTIVCTIHQPSSEVYDMFDRLLLMAEGRTAYMGESKQIIPFFRELGYNCPLHYNPADFFIQTLAIRPNDEAEDSRKRVQAICNTYDNTIGQNIRESVETINRTELDQSQIKKAQMRRSPYKASWFEQFRAVFWRSWKTQFKDPMVVTIRAVTTIFIALLVGVIYLRQDYNQEGIMNINGAIFLMLTNLTFQNVFAVVNVFAAELPVFLREHFNGMYRTDVYYLTKTFAELPIFIVLPFIFTSIIYWMIGMNDDINRFLIACGIIILIVNIACSFGYMISCVTTSLNMALAIGPVLIIPFLLFGGFFLNSGSVPVWLIWLKYMSWFYYGNEALTINQWKDVEIECNYADNSTSCVPDGNILLENLGFNQDNLILDICMLAVLFLSFRIIAFCGILFKTYRPQ